MPLVCDRIETGSATEPRDSLVQIIIRIRPRYDPRSINFNKVELEACIENLS